MVDLNPYGRKGCACWLDEGSWMPNAGCRYHGLLADYQPPRQDTGVYSVIRPSEDLSTPPDGPECAAGVHSMFDFCPGGCLNEVFDSGGNDIDIRPVDHGQRISVSETDQMDDLVVGGDDAEQVDSLTDAYSNPRLIGPTTERKETGVLATVRGWARRFGDWLDPHAAHARTVREFRSDLYGRQPRDQGRER